MRKKLLLADDSITIQKVVELTFPAEEFQVVTAGNGRLAVEKAGAFLPDIVLCDVIMPQLDGYQVCEALRAMPELKDVPILLLNGAFEPYDPDRARAAGALGNVSKPFDPPALVAKVKEILAQRVVAPPPPIAAETVPFEPEPEPEPQAELEATAVEPNTFTWDDSDGQAISTMEVPSDVREFAARSMALDTPVFAVAESESESEPEPAPDAADGFAPEPFSPESLSMVETETPDFSETLHDPLASPASEPSFELEPETPAAEMEFSAPEPQEEAQDLETASPIQESAVLEASAEPAPEAEAPASAFSEESLALAPMSFEEAPEVSVEEGPAQKLVDSSLPKTLPPMASPFGSAAIPGEPDFASRTELEAEFEAQAFDTPSASVAPEADPEPAFEPEGLESPGPEPMAVESAPFEDPSPAFQTAATDPALSSALDEASADVSGAEPPQAATAATVDGVPALPSDSGADSGAAEVAVPVEMVQQIAQRVISQVSERVIREIAWDVIPALAEKLIKAEIERIKARAESERD